MLAAVLKSGELLDTSVRHGFFAIQAETKTAGGAPNVQLGDIEATTRHDREAVDGQETVGVR